MLNFISKIFGGSKSEKDVKGITPIVERIKEEFAKLSGISHEDLRGKTGEFKTRISDYLVDIDSEVKELKARSEGDLPVEEKEELYTEIDKLEKKRDEKLEEILKEILPEAFAVVKETATRFYNNPTITVKANDLDKNLSVKKDYITIDGDNAIYQNTWVAAGNKITWDMIHYDVQLIGGVVLHEGKIAEMATGEGKTLVATLPAYLNALAGLGVHMVTVNDYLARRDSEWMGPIYNFLGLTVDCIDKHEPNSEERRDAYNCDITFGTNNEFGFDYLRDNMVHTPEERVQRKLHYAMVDEVDSVLIDDARTPLIISGPVPKGDEQEFQHLKPRIVKLYEAQKRITTGFLNDARKLIAEGKDGSNEGEGGLALLRAFRGLPKYSQLIKFLSEPGMRVILQKAENHYLADQQKDMPKVDAKLLFVIDEKNNQVDLTDLGVDMITEAGEDKNFFIIPDVGAVLADLEKTDLSPEEKVTQKDKLLNDFAIKSERIHSVVQLLKAYTLFEKDVEYVIMDGKVKIVDEQTGRVLEGRRYSDGLHQAIEAKENVKVEAATQTFATVTLQNYFRMYHKLAGMTGTAETEAGELWNIYKLDVVVIPTNRAITRGDREDLVYKTKREKYKYAIDEIEALSKAGRPVLVGTTAVDVSELLSRMLKMKGIKHNVLNAKQHQREAEIVQEAGKAGTVTIATNMAGRGTDIKLGPGVKEAGGLAIVGTERHESRRVDRQLRGRAGRQGDPGTTQFYVSLEDDLMRLFGSDRISKFMDRFGYKEGEVIQHSMITSSIERAQKKVEENKFGIRKRLLEYDDVMNAQRDVIYKKRSHALYGDRLAVDINNMLHDLCEELADQYSESADYEGLKLDVLRILAMEVPFTEQEFKDSKEGDLANRLFDAATEYYKRKSQHIADETYPVLKDIQDTKGEQIENVVIPFTDGRRGIQVIVNLKKALDPNQHEVVTEFEKRIALSIIDDAWKEHLREMDELKTSVQNAVYEQKDPLLIYKLEAFELFKKMMSEVNRDVISFLFKGNLPDQQGQPQKVSQARQQKTDMSRMKTGRENMGALTNPEGNYTGGNGNGQPQQDGQPQQPREKLQPVRVEKKVGRNDPCPCGSGKKYKNCHGKEA